MDFFLEIRLCRHDNCFSKTGNIIKSKCTPCLKNRTLLKKKGNFLIAGMLFNRYTTAALITTFFKNSISNKKSMYDSQKNIHRSTTTQTHKHTHSR